MSFLRSCYDYKQWGGMPQEATKAHQSATKKPGFDWKYARELQNSGTYTTDQNKSEGSTTQSEIEKGVRHLHNLHIKNEIKKGLGEDVKYVVTGCDVCQDILRTVMNLHTQEGYDGMFKSDSFVYPMYESLITRNDANNNIPTDKSVIKTPLAFPGSICPSSRPDTDKQSLNLVGGNVKNTAEEKLGNMMPRNYQRTPCSLSAHSNHGMNAPSTAAQGFAEQSTVKNSNRLLNSSRSVKNCPKHLPNNKTSFGLINQGAENTRQERSYERTSYGRVNHGAESARQEGSLKDIQQDPSTNDEEINPFLRAILKHQERLNKDKDYNARKKEFERRSQNLPLNDEKKKSKDVLEKVNLESKKSTEKENKTTAKPSPSEVKRAPLHSKETQTEKDESFPENNITVGINMVAPTYPVYPMNKYFYNPYGRQPRMNYDPRTMYYGYSNYPYRTMSVSWADPYELLGTKLIAVQQAKDTFAINYCSVISGNKICVKPPV